MLMLRCVAASLLAILLTALNTVDAVATTEPLAADTELFTIYGIEIDIVANTAEQARRQAMDEAQRQAFDRLTGKLVASGSQQSVPPPAGSMLNRLVQSVDVFDERSSSTRYLARMDISFNAEAVRQFLGESGLAFTESKGGPFLLLPLYDTGVGLKLTQPHPWRAAFRAAEPENRLVSYRLAKDDIKARRLLAPRRLTFADSLELSDLAKSFDLSEAVLAKARVNIDPATGRTVLRYHVLTGRFLGLVRSGDVIARAGETREELLLRAADAVLTAVDSVWKVRTLIAGQQRNDLVARVPLSGLDDWLAVRDRLTRVALLRNIDIAEAGLPVTRLILGYVGTLDQLRLALEQERLVLRPAGEGDGFVLQLAEQEQTTPLQSEADDGEPPADAMRNTAGNDIGNRDR